MGARFHINSISVYGGTAPIQKVPPQAFVNIEVTGYYRRLTTGGSAWDGMEIQAQTGPIAHASQGGNVCDASGYASRFRDDGNWDFEKELKHPDSKVYSTKVGTGAPLFVGKTIPLNRWIGMKFLVYNVDAGTKFPSGDISGCPNLTANMAITEGHGTLLLRTDNEKCEWKMVSIREIQVDGTVSARLP